MILLHTWFHFNVLRRWISRQTRPFRDNLHAAITFCVHCFRSDQNLEEEPRPKFKPRLWLHAPGKHLKFSRILLFPAGTAGKSYLILRSPKPIHIYTAASLTSPVFLDLTSTAGIEAGQLHLETTLPSWHATGQANIVHILKLGRWFPHTSTTLSRLWYLASPSSQATEVAEWIPDRKSFIKVLSV